MNEITKTDDSYLTKSLETLPEKIPSVILFYSLKHGRKVDIRLKIDGQGELEISNDIPLMVELVSQERDLLITPIAVNYPDLTASFTIPEIIKPGSYVLQVTYHNLVLDSTTFDVLDEESTRQMVEFDRGLEVQDRVYEAIEKSSYEQAIDLQKEAAKHFLNANNPELAASSWEDLADILYDKNELELSKQVLQEAKVYQAIGEGNYAQAIKLHEEVAKYFLNANNPELAASSWEDLGDILYEKNELLFSKQALQEALRIYSGIEELEDREEILTRLRKKIEIIPSDPEPEKPKTKIQFLREEKGYSQSQLAVLVGVTSEIVQAWEQGQGFEKIKQFFELSQVLNCKIDDLMEIKHDVLFKDVKPSSKRQICSNIRRLKVLVDADFLINPQRNADRLFSLINSHRELEVAVIRECLERACQSRGINLDDFLSTFPLSGIRVISRHDLRESESSSLLAYLESAANYTTDFDSQLEIAYAFSLGIYRILTDKETDFEEADIRTSLKVISIDKLEDMVTGPSKPEPIKPIKSKIQILIDFLTKWIRNKKAWSFLLLPLITVLAVIFIPSILDKITFRNYCPLDENRVRSCGETLLIDEQEADLELFRNSQADAAKSFQNSRYEDAVNSFKIAFKQYKSPETLIYLNNALLEANKKKANTIAVAVPISKAKGTATNEDRDLAKEILRGVAHVQTLVNKCLLPNEFDFLPDSIKENNRENNPLCDKIKGKRKGLRVIIADDANDKDQAENLASELNNLNDKSILAVIGHYASDLTSELINSYNTNKLVLLSFGSTSESPVFMKPDDYFFRTVPRVSFHANKLVEKMKKEGYQNPAIFYNEGSDFSKSMYDAFKKRAKDEQIQANLVFNNKSAYFAEEDRFNVSAVLDTAKNGDVLVLFPDGQTTGSTPNAIKIMEENQGGKPILGTWTLRSNRFLKAAKGEPNLVIKEKLIAYSPYDPSQRKNQDYITEAKKLWGDANSPITALSYDAAWVLVNAFLKTTNRTNLKYTLNELGTIKNGATGDIIFDENGNRKDLDGLLLRVIKDKNTDSGLRFEPLK